MGRFSEAPLQLAGCFPEAAEHFQLISLCCCFPLICYARSYLVTALSARIRVNSTRFTSGFVPVQGGGAQPRSPPESPFLNLPAEDFQGWARRVSPSSGPGPPPAPGVGFSQLWRLGQGLGVRGEPALAARSRKVGATPVGLGVISGLAGAEVLQLIQREAPTKETRGATGGGGGKRSTSLSVLTRPPEPSQRALSQADSRETRAAMSGGCSRGPGAGDARLRLARLALVLLGWVSSSSLTSLATSSTSSASFLASAVSAQPPLPSQCPPPCECSEAARTVKCVNSDLTEVPADLPPYVRNLFLTGNQLAVLPAGAFARGPLLAELTALNLSGSHLQEVHAGAFENLPSLRQLDLSHNPLRKLSPFAFSGSNASISAPSPLVELILNHVLPPVDKEEKWSIEGMVAAALRAGQALRGLRRLELTSNHFLYLPQDVLVQLPELRHLDLRNNSLVSLTYVSFRNLTHLESLHLEDNALKVLHNGTLAELQGLPQVKVFLDNNPWVCDCHMVDMVTWLKETEVVQSKAGLTCAFPDKMRNRVLLELNSSDLECDPILPPSLQTSYVFLGIVLALIGAIFLLVLYLNRKGIKKWMHNIRDACRDHMEGYHYRYEINADPRLTNLSSNSDV